MRTLTGRSRSFLLSIALLVAALGTHAQTAPTPAPDPEAARVQAIAEEAYIYGLPLVMTYGVMYAFSIDSGSTEYKAPFNHLRKLSSLLTHADKGIPFGNNDTLYSMAWLDLRAEPMVISLPAIEKSRYHSVMLTDLSSVNHGLIAPRTSGNRAGDFLVVGPEWKGDVPKGIKGVYRATSQFTMALVRTQVRNAQDLEAVKAIQAGYRLRPLSSYLGKTPPPAAPEIAFPKIDRELAKANFFGYLDFVLPFVPVRPEDRELRERLASIGLGVGNLDVFKAIAGKYPNELKLGVKAGDQKINALVDAAGPRAGGWNWNYSLDTDREHYTGDYVKRAAMSRAAPYGLNASEAMYPVTNTLPNGEPLDGSKHNYTLTFKAGDFPPAELFWSLTIYDGATRAFTENRLQRYLINSGMLPDMKKHPDGSLTIYIQKDSPGKDKEANWLPAPDGPTTLVLRVYGIGERLRANAWSLPPVVLAD